MVEGPTLTLRIIFGHVDNFGADRSIFFHMQNWKIRGVFKGVFMRTPYAPEAY
jgi:hypothetical protein